MSSPKPWPTFGLRTATLALGLVAVAPTVGAQQFTMHVEPAVAVMLDDPQTDRFTPGVYGAVRPGVAIGKVVSFQWSYAALLLPKDAAFSEMGVAHSLSTGVRLRPFAPLAKDTQTLGGLFVDGNFGHIWTGSLSRFGFDTGIGYGVQVSPAFSLGPVLRYSHIFQPNDIPNQDPSDAQYLTAGLNLTFGGPRKSAATCPEPLTCPDVVAVAVAVAEVVETCPDMDGDAICDADDRCPTIPGSADLFGCSTNVCVGAPLVALVQFPFDSATLPMPNDADPQSMDPVLDAVARAMAQDPSCRVCVVGHASEEGPAAHNDTLSAERAMAVKGYLGARGLDPGRIAATGMGASCQLDPWESRTLNRRVDFRRLMEGESCPTECPE